MANNSFSRPRGTQDILPTVQPSWRFVSETFSRLSLQAGFERISTPMFESADLFARGVGESTEVVAKEMYTFTDRSNNQLALKPESTAGVVRAYLENHLDNMPKPVKLFYIEPHFRYERPQAGRYRQHHQLGVEVFGSSEAYIDAHVIALGVRLFRELGIKFSLQINSIGDSKMRAKYLSALVNYFQPIADKLPEVALLQLKQNPMRILDSKDETVLKLIEEAPQILDFLDTATKDHFAQVLECLDELDIAYELNPRLVRGLDYYNRTVFEFKGSHIGQQDSIGGGGRYDGLVELLGGRSTPAVGFGLGIERIMLELQRSERQISPANPQICVVGLGEAVGSQVFSLSEKLLNADLSVVTSYGRGSMSDQLATASKLGVSYCLIIGQKELKSERVIVKEMVSGNQENVPLNEVVNNMLARF